MTTVLIVANETLISRSLVDAVRRRAQRGDSPSFVVIAPQARPRAGLVIYDETVRNAAQHRVDEAVQALHELGLAAEGEVMDPDPYMAVTDAVAEYRPDEVIISTHPETRSGWLRRDLVERVREATGLPVEHVVVDLDAEQAVETHTLVVANETVGGEPLFGLLRGKAAEKPHRFTVIVPQGGGAGLDAQRARQRLSRVLERMEREGLAAAGTIADPDPYTAIINALQFYRVDEIVISTHPVTRSGWLRADLIERVRRTTARPVEHVVVDLEAGARAGGE